MIDTHVHLLPGVDDGPADAGQALAMARRAVADGTRTAVVTPHHLNGLYTNEARRIRREVMAFRKLLAQENVPLEVHPGSEVHLVPELPEALEAGTAMSVADRGRAVLVELPARHLPIGVEPILQACVAQGATPVIAHVERNRALAEHPETLARWIRLGCRAQATAGSFAGQFGPSAERAAWCMLERGLIHVLASDGHRARGRVASMASGREAVAEHLGPDVAELLTETYPRALLEGKALDLGLLNRALAARPRSRARWWQRLLEPAATR